MSDCCSNIRGEPAFPVRGQCPVNGKEYTAVSTKTIKHHLLRPWRRPLKDQGYYFCSDPDCDVVYFGEDGEVIDQSCLRTIVGLKKPSEESLLCYCFGITMGEAQANPAAKAFVIEETKKKACACEIRNPSGKCCLGDFPKAGKR